VLEAMDAPGSSSQESQGKSRTLICVANTHIHANPELNDVKLWQVHTLLKGLEKIAAR
jgi:CCR4-NOT transcription complex subunit 6